MSKERIEAQTRAWVNEVVIDLDLCPFAAPSLERDALRVVVTEACSAETIADALIAELGALQEPEAEGVESCLLVVPDGLEDFLAFNAFLEVADRILEDLDLVGVFQLASFHPDYRFADAPDDDPAHYTNRAPWPTLHLLWESAVGRAVATHPDPSGIPARNVERLRIMGSKALAERLEAIGSSDAD